ncbi:MAG: MFS transporter [Pedobacter sp.]|uniref:MFS transporter n=1 Tax=Pedobacter sp. TaxID=1411316 RepID=UPI0033998E11
MNDIISKNTHRIFLSTFFFMSGFSFSTWASRIPTIKMAFGFNDAELGSILLAMPVGSLIGLPITGWLVSRYDSRIPLTVGYALNSVAMALIGFTHNTVALVVAVVLFAFTSRIFNISMNTQAITVQKLFTKKINGSFHGFWSTGGIAGVAFSTVLLALNASIQVHFLIVASITLLMAAYSFRFLLKGDRSASGNKIIIGKPDPYILCLGIVAFLSAICEGGMFDWSGIYFQQVLHVKIFTYGYLIFMLFMAMSRFLSDLIIGKIGMAATYLMSAVFIISGILMAIVIPHFWIAMIGFSLVGFGTASVIPMSYSMAGNSRKYSAGMAISIIATYYITGTFLGPPLIGYLAHAFGLRIAFIVFGACGLLLIPVSQLVFKYKKFEEEII